MNTVRPLPVRVPLVQAETLDSYLSRLASANHLDPRELRAYLGIRTRTRPPDLDTLATMTGHPARRLSVVLADARPPPGRTRLSPLPGRAACRRCTTRRGITGDVRCVDPDQRVCRRHRRWLGGLLDNVTYQHDVARVPEVVRAQRRHCALLRRQGVERGRGAIHWAGTIVGRWTERGEWGLHRQRRFAQLGVDPAGVEPDTSLLAMVNYPEVVSLAAVLADPQWRAVASNDHRLDRIPFELEVSRRLNIARTGFALGDPLIDWEEGWAHINRLRLHQQPDYRGPEVWLAGST